MRRIVVIAVACSLVACSGPPELPPARSTVPPATQRTYGVPGDPAEPGGGGPGGGTSEPGTNGDGGTTPKAGLPGPLTADRSALPPARGSYRYRVVTTSTFGGEPVRYRSFVEYRRTRARDANGGWMQRERIQSEGTTTSETYTYRGSSARILQTRRVQNAAGGRIVCTYRRPVRVLELPLTVGLAWRQREPGCEESESGSSATRSRMRFEVLARETIVIDRTRVICFVVDRVSRTPSSIEGEEPRVTRERSWFAPAYSLIVKRRSRSGGTVSEQTLLALQPS